MRNIKPQTSVYLLRVFVLCIVLAVYFFIPGIHEFFHRGISYLRYRDFDSLRQFVLSFGVWAPLTSILLMALQSLIPLVPGLIITITNAWIFGWLYGAIYSWIGALLGATLDFCIARWYGRPAVEFFVNKKHLLMSDNFFKKYGVFFVLMTRLTPIIPFKVVSYGAGLTTISSFQYLAATAVGQTPAILLYSVLGHNLSQNLHLTFVVTSIFIVLGILGYCYWGKLEDRLFSNKK